MLKRFFILGITTIALAACINKNPENSKNIRNLKTFLAEDPGRISELGKHISEDESKLAAQLINEHLKAEFKKEYESEWQNETLILGDHQLKFKYKKFGEKPPEGWSLYISMHGGGNAPAEVNDQQWGNQQKLYEPEEGIYMAPRAPTNTWNLWHQEHIDAFFALFIQLSNVFEDINTNRVYLTGYSAGGDGTYQLAPRMADWFAAAAMMAGHPNDASPLGLRNLPFDIQMGAEDAAYNRNNIAAQWGEMLDSLQENDPHGYVHDVQIHEGMGHWMEKKDTVAIEWMAQFERVAYPDKVVWKQSGVTHSRFYWLEVPKEEAVKDAEIIASIDGQTITIEKADQIHELLILLNDKMLDPDQNVKVLYKDKVLYDAVPTRNIASIWKSLDQRNDLNQYFSAEIALTLN
ncbi:alpha/beta hydrolase [Maribellus sediminis]|uniref:alpha/beta hydrolase n=1 Tax=Maribellus sediminis TaxID=2696285 RepID=UPI001430AE5F|nr:alpha/beta hydrolase [Maribellus sediminis]